MKKTETVIKKGKLRIAVFLLMMFMIIGTGQAWGAAPDWTQMGPSPITTGTFNASSIVVLNGTPYLAYTKYNGAGVMKYDGASWSAVGSSFTTDHCNNVAMVASGTTLYVAYSDVNFDCINVVKCDTSSGGVWSSLGTANSSKAPSQDSALSLAVNSDSDIYMGYTDYSSGNFKMFHYNGSAWAWQFNTGGSTGFVTSVNGVAYAAYRNGASEFRLDKNSGSGWTKMKDLNGPPIGICHDDSGKIYILTQDVSNSFNLSVALYKTASDSLSIVGSDLPTSWSQSPSISVDNGTVYVVCHYSDNAILYACQSANDWEPVGSSITGAYYGDMTAYNGTAYYAYANSYNLTAKMIIYPVPVPKVTGVSPTAGPEAGGTTVTIDGANFTGATAVSFGATPASSFSVVNSTQITAVAPAGTGTVDVTVTGPDGTSAVSSNDRFTYCQAPTVTSISPDKGAASGGTSVVITGTNFTDATAVSFGGTPASSFSIDSSTQITATAPAGTGTVDLTVTGPGGTSATSSSDQLTYYQKPAVTGISPASGPEAGGTSVVITGTDFTGAAAVNFGATSASSFSVSSSTAITATAPAGTGTVDVRVTGPGGTSTANSSDQFTYLPKPTITGISPASGPTAGGTSVVITGTNFTSAAAVSFGGSAATSFTVNSSTQITATAPAGTGTVDVTVTGTGGTSVASSNDQFTYYQKPTVTGVSPAGGSTAGGTSVVITGTNFTGATAVSFGGTTASGVTVNSSTQISATAPAGTGTVHVTVTGPGGTSATSTADQYTYQTLYTVTIGTLSGGSIIASPAAAIAGTTINLAVTPASGKQLKAGTLKYNDGTDHSITGTSFNMPAANVTVTAEFETLVTDADKVAADKAALVMGYASGDSASSVTHNLTFTTTGAVYGSGITWVSSNAAIISSSGAVTRPVFSSGDAIVTVTAAVNKNEITDTKAFTLTVIKLPLGVYNVTFNKNGGDTEASPTALTTSGGAVGALPTAPSRSGFTFSGWNTLQNGSGTVFTTATAVTSNITVYAQWTAIPSGGNGDSHKSSNTPPTDQTKTNSSSSGNESIATTTATASVDSSGKASVTVTPAQINDAVSKAVTEAGKKDNGTPVVEIEVKADANAKTVEANLPKTAVDVLDKSAVARLDVSTPVADITFDSNALSTISDEASADVKITASKVDTSALSAEAKQVVGDRPVFNFSVTSGDKNISQFGGNVTVSVPYSPKPGEDTNAIVIYYINAEGRPEIVSDCVYDAALGRITFNTNHFSQYAVGYNQVTFKDVAGNAWYGKAVEFIAAREITTGTSNGYFSPQAKLTRGQFIVMLMKAYEIAPDLNPKENFTDAGSTYYTGYLAAAKSLGITAGVGNNMSAPEKEITRQEMFTLMYNALKSIGKLPQGNSGESLSSYSDAGNIDSWAKDAVKLFAKTGIINGSGNKLSPKDTTTRAQMAQVLYSLLLK